MLIQCPICTELFTESSTVVILKCGHVFHEVCLLKWWDSKLNCPQCRTACRRCSTTKVYFSMGNELNNSKIEDQEHSYKLIEDLSLAKATVKEKSLENALLVQEKNRLAEQVADITVKLKLSKARMTKTESDKKVVEEHLKTFISSYDSANKENIQLKKQAQILNNVQLVINGCQEEIESLMSNSTDLQQLATWCTVYRRELDKKKIDLKQALDTIRRLRKEAESYRIRCEERDQRVKVLEEIDLNTKEIISGLEESVRSLTKKIVALQASIDSPRPTTKSLVHRLLHESPAPTNLSFLNDSFMTPLAPRSELVTRLKINDSKPAGELMDTNKDKENITTRKRKSSSDDDDDGNNSNNNNNKVLITSGKLKEDLKDKEKSLDVVKKLKRNVDKPEMSNTSIQNPILGLGIFKKHNSIKPSSFMAASSSSSSNAADRVVVRKGYNGLGGHEKFVGMRDTMRQSTISDHVPKVTFPTISANVRKNMGPSTSSQPTSKKKLFQASSFSSIDDFF